MKVAIIGGGLVGSYLGWKLSRKHEITIFEQNRKIGKTSCSGLISERLWEFIPKNNRLVQNTIESTVIHLPKKEIKLEFDPRMLVINRPSLDRYIANLAKKAGAKVILEKIDKLPSGFDFIIGCDGSLSKTRKLLNLPDPKFSLGIKCLVNKEDETKEVNTWPIREGFAWKIPRGKTTEYGVMSSPELAKVEFLDFCLKNDITPEQQYSALIPQGLILSNRRRIALCGDAAGLTKPHTGGGVIWGLISAEILLDTFPSVSKYNQALKRFFGSKIFNLTFTNKVGRFLGNKLPQILPGTRKIDSDFLFRVRPASS